METKIKAVSRETLGARKVSAVAVLSDLEEEILASGLDYSDWVCGITKDPGSLAGRLKPAIGTLTCRYAGSELDARQIEIILRRKGCQVIPHLGEEAAYVFIFLPGAEAPIN